MVLISRLGWRKGQMTLFIIMGIVILLAVAVTIFIVYRQAAPTPDEDRVVLGEVPLEFREISSYIESCIIQEAEQGLKMLGERGGYIDFQKWNIRPGMSSVTGNAVAFSGSIDAGLSGNDMIVPYWWYMSSGNDCTEDCEFDLEMPSLFREGGEPSIEGQLDEYVNDHLRQCIDFTFFLNRGYNIEERGEIDTETIVTENNVQFYVKYPLKVEIEGAEQELFEFFVPVPIDIKSMYEQALIIQNFEATNHFIERDALNMIVGFSGFDSEDKLPPMSGLKFNFGPGIVWSKKKVEENLKEMFTTYTPLLKVYGSLNYEQFEFEDDEYVKEALYNQGKTIPSKAEFGSFSVNFDFIPFWDIYLDLNCDGDVCRPESAMTDVLSFIGVHRYNFVYELSYPVLITIRDPTALNNRGYTFQYFVESNIRRNEPLTSASILTQSIDAGETKSMMCDPDKRNSGNITVDVKDAVTNDVLEDASVIYICGGESCSIGSTDENGILVSQFPVCFGGVITLFKEEYLQESQFLTTSLDEEQSVTMEMDPLRDINYTIKKRKVVKTAGGWVFRSNEVGLDESEEAVLTLTRKSEFGTEDYSTSVQYPKIDSGQTLRIAPGEYEISGNLIVYQDYRIPESEEEYGGEEVTIPALVINNSMLAGGVETTYNFTVEDIDNNKNVILYVVGIDIIGVPENEREFDDLSELNNITGYSTLYANLLEPRFT